MTDRTPAVEAVFTPVQQPTRLEATVRRLGTATRLGLLAPGSRLPPQRALAVQLCINRSTLRLALTTLVEDGQLVSLHGRRGGTFVAAAPPLSVGRDAKPLEGAAQDLLDQRLAIETGAIVLAAERAEPADLDQLDALVDRMAAAKSFEDYHRADVRFHIGVAEAAHSPRLVTAMTDIHGQMTDLIARIVYREDGLARSNDQHRRLVTLLRRSASPLAVRLMRDHIRQTERILTA